MFKCYFKQNDTRVININAFKRFFKDSGSNPDGNQSSLTGKKIVSFLWINFLYVIAVLWSIVVSFEFVE